MLLELAIGDAYGAGFEYVDRTVVERENSLQSYVKHPTHGIVPGRYTDDTQMSIAVAEAIVSGQPWTAQLLADHFVAAFRRDPRLGYAGRFYEFLQSVSTGEEFLQRIEPGSDKSGAAMRACPIGVIATPDAVIRYATIQARLTHDTKDGIASACAAALMAHYFLYRLGPKAELGVFLNRHVPGYSWDRPYVGKVKSKGWMSSHAAVTSIMRNDRLSELLRDCIAFTGDVDTVAAIALGAASSSEEVEDDLPDKLVWSLENGRFGKDYVIDLDTKLIGLMRS